MVAQNDTPDWQGYNQAGGQVTPSSSFYTLGAHQTVHAYTATPGVQYVIYSISFNLRDSSGTSIIWVSTLDNFPFFVYSPRGAASFTVDFGGWALPIGSGIDWVNQTATPMVVPDQYTMMMQTLQH